MRRPAGRLGARVSPGAAARVLLTAAFAATRAFAAVAPAEAAQSGELLREADGRAYRVERVPKAGARFERIDAHTVRYYPFARYQVAGEDADYFYVKQYATSAQKPPAAAPPFVNKVDIAQTRRFSLQDIGDGLPRAGQWRGDFSLADVDGDGRIDIVLAPARKSLSRPVVLRRSGDAWVRLRDLDFPPLPYDYGAAVAADFNGDGRTDLALGMHLRGVTVLAGDGKGGFRRYDEGLPLGMPGSPTPPAWSTHQLGALDWNGDGKPDLIAVNERMLGRNARFGAVSIFVGRRGTWSLASLPAAAMPGGNPLLLNMAGEQGRTAIVVGNAPNGHAQAYEYAKGRVVARALDGVPAGAILRAGAAVDRRGDDGFMLALAYQYNTAQGWQTAVDVFRRSGDRYARRALHLEPALTIGALAWGHLGNGRADDLAALRSDGALLLFAADGKGGYSRDRVEPAPAWRAGCEGHALRLRDVDGDGRDEIIAAFAGEPNAYMLRRDCVGGGGIAAWQVSEAAPQP